MDCRLLILLLVLVASGCRSTHMACAVQAELPNGHGRVSVTLYDDGLQRR